MKYSFTKLNLSNVFIIIVIKHESSNIEDLNNIFTMKLQIIVNCSKKNCIIRKKNCIKKA
jgi:uncharacterized protein YfkK (UPF0435 family)